MYLVHSVYKLEHRKLIPSTNFHKKIFLRKNVETFNYCIFRIQIFVDTIDVPPPTGVDILLLVPLSL